MIPCEFSDGDRHINLETDYPFKNSMTYHVQTKSKFTFKIRIPDFAQNIKVNGQSVCSDMLSFDVPANSDMVIRISFETIPYFKKRPHGLYAIQCGSLVFSIPISYEKHMLEYTKDGVERKFPYCDYEYLPTSDWNYAYCDEPLQVQFHGVSDIPFSSRQPSITLQAEVKRINWGLEDGYETVCAKTPTSRKPISEKQEITLYPYGSAKLRMTELPIVK